MNTALDRTPLGMAGRLEMSVLDSSVLVGNPLGDPHVREVAVYVPPGAEDRKLPIVFLLSAFTGTPAPLWESHPWKRGALWHYAEAVQKKLAEPAVICMPNTFTRMGGSQFVNSTATGRYQDYVLDELVPFMDQHASVDPERRAVVGKSSGGFGALHLCTAAPGTFRVAASIAGDCHFEYCFGSECLTAARELARVGGVRAFLDSFYAKPELKGDAHAALNILAMSACYSPNPDAELGFDLPMDLRTGERDQRVWQRWLSFDPVQACAAKPQGLRDLDLLYLEAGVRDEFHLQFGLRVLCNSLRQANIEFEHHEFDGGHFGMDARYQDVLPKLTRALAELA